MIPKSGRRRRSLAALLLLIPMTAYLGWRIDTHREAWAGMGPAAIGLICALLVALLLWRSRGRPDRMTLWLVETAIFVPVLLYVQYRNGELTAQSAGAGAVGIAVLLGLMNAFYGANDPISSGGRVQDYPLTDRPKNDPRRPL